MRFFGLSIPAGVNGDNILDLAVALASLIVGGVLLSGGDHQSANA